MEEERNKTEADFQIERLQKLKQEKEEKRKKIMIDAIDLPQPEVKIQISQTRRQRYILIEKEIYERVHKILSNINRNKPSGKISKKKFINKILKEVLDCIEKEEINNIEDIKKIFKEKI